MHIAVDAAGVTAGGEGAPEAAGDVGVRKDDRTTAFLTRQLRVFMERSSGQSGEVLMLGSSIFRGHALDVFCASSSGADVIQAIRKKKKAVATVQYVLVVGYEVLV